MANDPVPNLRFTMAKTLGDIARVLPPALVQAQVRPVLTTLANGDTDDDVRYFAGVSLAQLAPK